MADAGAQQQRRRSTALSSKHGQIRDETEHRLVSVQSRRRISRSDICLNTNYGYASVYTRNDWELIFTFPFPPISMQSIHISSHSQFKSYSLFHGIPIWLFPFPSHPKTHTSSSSSSSRSQRAQGSSYAVSATSTRILKKHAQTRKPFNMTCAFDRNECTDILCHIFCRARGGNLRPA